MPSIIRPSPLVASPSRILLATQDHGSLYNNTSPIKGLGEVRARDRTRVHTNVTRLLGVLRESFKRARKPTIFGIDIMKHHQPTRLLARSRITSPFRRPVYPLPFYSLLALSLVERRILVFSCPTCRTGADIHIDIFIFYIYIFIYTLYKTKSTVILIKFRKI